MNVICNVMLVVKNIFLSIFRYHNPKVMSDIETIEYIKKYEANIGRFGDGELSLMMGKSLNFQAYNEEMAKRLCEVINRKKFLTCIPNIFNAKYFNKKLITKEEYDFWVKNKIKYGYAWGKYFNKNKICGDAFISRFYMRFNDKSKVEQYICRLKSLWEDRNVIIVEGETSQIGIGNNILDNAKSIRRIICPSSDAFDLYDNILETIKKSYNDGDLVLMALGPTATILAYDLSKENIWALDMGHFDIEYEWFLVRADKKIPIRNKHVNECNQIGNIEKDNKKYLKEIVCTIK